MIGEEKGGAFSKPSSKLLDRSGAFKAFNQMLIDDPMTGYIYECSSAGAVSSSVRSLFNAIYDRYGPYFKGVAEEADVAIKNAAEALQRELRYAGVARSHDDSRAISADVMMSARQFMTHRTHTDRQREYEHLQKEHFSKLHGTGVHDNTDPTFRGLIEDMKLLGHANQYFEKKLKLLFKAIDSENHSISALQAAAQMMSDSETAFDRALGVAAHTAREYYDGHPALKRNKEDCPALFSTPYVGLLGEAPKWIVTEEYRKHLQHDALRSLSESGAISPLIAAVLVDAQKHVAREVAIDFARAKATGTLTLKNADRQEELRSKLGRKLRVIAGLADLLVKEGLLHVVDKAELKKNEAGLTAIMVDFFTLSAGRGIER